MNMMKLILFAAVLGFVAQAQAKTLICGYDQIDEIARYDLANIELTERELNESEQELLTYTIDSQWNCNEGVTLVGALAVWDSDQVLYLANCYADSLGSVRVTLELECQELGRANDKIIPPDDNPDIRYPM